MTDSSAELPHDRPLDQGDRGDPGEPWFVAAFRADYPRVYPHRDLASARAEVAHLVARGLAEPVLDLCCGFGRHTLALRDQGLSAFGADLSMELLLLARELPGAEESLRGRLSRADARRLPFHGEAFGSVAMLFSSFGYFDERSNAAVLAEVARVLAPGGTAVFDLMNPARVRSGLVPETRTERGGVVLLERRALQDGGRRVVKDVRLEEAGRVRTWREDVRLYEPAEFDRISAEAGLRVFDREGDFGATGEPSARIEFDPGSPRQIVWARRESGGGGYTCAAPGSAANAARPPRTHG